MATKARNELTSLQCRMARAGLRWSVADLATKAEVSKTTVSRFEGGHTRPARATLARLRQELEAAGAQFQNGDGVRVKIEGN